MSAPLMSHVLTGVHVLLTRPDPGRWLLGLGLVVAGAFSGRRSTPGLQGGVPNPFGR